MAHYSRALALCGTDAALWSNRAAAYLAKGWWVCCRHFCQNRGIALRVAAVAASCQVSAHVACHLPLPTWMPACRGEQALTDAEHALSLRPDWAKAWGRKAAALLQLGRVGAAAEAYQRGLQLEPGNAALREGLVQAQTAQRQQQRAAAAGSKHSASAVQAQSLKPALGAQLERSESYPASGHSRGNGSTSSSLTSPLPHSASTCLPGADSGGSGGNCESSTTASPVVSPHTSNNISGTN